jgi:phage shock protein A
MPDEPNPEPAAADPGYTPGGVPTFESVREKIETRYGTATGATELDAETPEGRTVEEQYNARQRAAAERLKQIRESMRGDTGAAGPATSESEQRDNS